MSDVIDALKEEVAEAAGVTEVVAAEVISQFLAIAQSAADPDTRAALEALTACEAPKCLHITALGRDHDGVTLCPGCARARRLEAREAERIAATHGPEMRRLRA